MTTDNAPVKVQDFLDSAVESWYSGGNITVDNDRTKAAWEKLLFRARQEAATAAYSEGRKAGLKEMDEVCSSMCFAKHNEWIDAHRDWDYDGGALWKLRQEYSAK